MAKVSILMNCYNGEKYLHQAIDSVFAQTFTDWQIIFVDNCSVDKSAEIAASYGEKVKTVTTDKNIPLYAARNFGLQHIGDSEFVAFLDVDDLWTADKLEKQLAKYQDDIAMVCSKIKAIDDKGDEIAVEFPKLHRGWVTQKLLLSNFIAISASIVRASVLKEELFDPQYNLLGDYDLWLRLSVNHKFDYVDEYLFIQRHHDQNLTKKAKGRWIKEMRSHYKSFFDKYKFRYPNIFLLMLKCEAGNAFGRY